MYVCVNSTWRKVKNEESVTCNHAGNSIALCYMYQHIYIKLLVFSHLFLFLTIYHSSKANRIAQNHEE